jgi:cytidine deaminase
MKSEDLHIQYKTYDSFDELSEADQVLLKKAEEVQAMAYAPYSKFGVGAAIELTTGEVVTGSNQENAAYPSGLCAERVALFAVGSQFPNGVIKTLAVSAPSANGLPGPPCGACRQVMLESERRQIGKIRILFGQSTGKIVEMEGAESLLPLAFKENFLP